MNQCVKRMGGVLLAALFIGTLGGCEGTQSGISLASDEPLAELAQDRVPTAGQEQGLVGEQDRWAQNRDCRWYRQSSASQQIVSAYCPLRSKVVTGGCRVQDTYLARSAPFVGDPQRAPENDTHWSQAGSRGDWTGWTCGRPSANRGTVTAFALCCEHF